MGLDTTHDAFSGAYSSFNRFRSIVAKAWGGSFPPHSNKTLDDRFIYFPDDAVETDGLVAFLKSNDCEGEFSPDVCKKMADEMEALLPKIKEIDDGGTGHISVHGGYYAVAKKYIAGCRLAHSRNETLIYE